MFPLYAALRRVKSTKTSLRALVKASTFRFGLSPYLVAILVAIGMFRAAGGIPMLSHALRPAMSAVGFPPDLLPLVFMRPLSGSGTLGVFSELVQHFGPDSLLARRQEPFTAALKLPSTCLPFTSGPLASAKLVTLSSPAFAPMQSASSLR